MSKLRKLLQTVPELGIAAPGLLTDGPTLLAQLGANPGCAILFWAGLAGLASADVLHKVFGDDLDEAELVERLKREINPDDVLALLERLVDGQAENDERSTAFEQAVNRIARDERIDLSVLDPADPGTPVVILYRAIAERFDRSESTLAELVGQLQAVQAGVDKLLDAAAVVVPNLQALLDERFARLHERLNLKEADRQAALTALMEEARDAAIEGWIAADQAVQRIGRLSGQVERQTDRIGQAVREGNEGLREEIQAVGAKVGQLAPAVETPPVAPPPTFPAVLIARERDLADLVAVLTGDSAVRAVVLHGALGLGKSELARAVLAHADLVKRYKRRRAFVRCDGLSSTADAAAAALTALGHPLTGGDPVNLLLARTNDAPAAIVLDNLEEVLAREDADRLNALIEGLGTSGDVCVIATARVPDPPPGVRWALACTPKDLDGEDRRAAFLGHAGGRFADDLALGPLLGRIGGRPLILRLLAHAAVRAGSLDRLDRAMRAEGMNALNRPLDGSAGGRLDSVASALAVSLELGGITPDSRAGRTFTALCHLPGGIAAEHEEPVLGEGAADLARLRGLTLVEEADVELADGEETAPGAKRLRVRASVRDAWLRRLGSPAPADGLEVVYLKLAMSARAIARKGGAAVVELLKPEIANVEWAIRRSLAQEQQIAVLATIAWAEFVQLTGAGTPELLVEAERVAEKRGFKSGQAHCAFFLAALAIRRGDPTAKESLARAERLYSRAENPVGQANCICQRFEIAARKGKAAADDLLIQAEELYRNAGDLLGQANCWLNRAKFAIQKDRPAADGMLASAEKLYGQASDPLGQANCSFQRAMLAMLRMDLSASGLFSKTEVLYEKAGDTLGQANCLRQQAVIAWWNDGHDAAVEILAQANDLFRITESRLSQAHCISDRGELEEDRGDMVMARAYFVRAAEAYEALDDWRMVGFMHQRLAKLAENDADRERHLADAAAAEARLPRMLDADED
ncbi:hypothetical protein [Alienimonas chondri]|uniref:AAA+ ATPase domain-containing protein n=1 Tax=Alienimonas chondri TaxID=2681879 RepID=A0ABX1VFJ8_9PLAN|nr:hypothetical protein [Alienimonas chondri]NNJ26598.1 hypothetical protein [Alienimonas chondri]